MGEEINIGDPVEYLVHRFGEADTWIPATVVYADHAQIAVADATGHRQAIARGFGFVRSSRKAPK